MNKIKHTLFRVTLYIICINIVFTVFNCKKDEEKNDIPVCKISNPRSGQEFEQGIPITITVKAYVPNGEIENVKIYINNEIVDTIFKIPYDYTWDTNNEEPGNQTIKAVATDKNGNRSSDEVIIFIQSKIVILYPPIASFSAKETSVYLGDTVFFTDRSANTPLSWSWDFGDGTTSTEQHPQHIYDALGSYTVSLTVENTKGTDVETKTSYIKVEENILKGFDTITDIEGNSYQTVNINNTWWMTENLTVTKYNDGALIDNIPGSTWNSTGSGAYCWYMNDEDTLGAIYGALYNGRAINTGKLCPTGWHVPSETEWNDLTELLGGNSVAGGKLKENGFDHWDDPNKDATNEVYFTALPGGFRSSLDGSFNEVNKTGVWWTSSSDNVASNISKAIYHSSGGVDQGYKGINDGLSVRCVKD